MTWVSESGHGNVKDAEKLGKAIKSFCPEFTDWYYNSTPRAQQGKAKNRELARAFECRLQNYINRKERQRADDLIHGSVVYAVGNQADAGACKIGTSKKPLDRFRSLKVGFPWELRVYRLFRGEGPRFEFRLHKLLQSEHIRGEWFRFTDEFKGIVEPRRSVPVSDLDLEQWFS